MHNSVYISRRNRASYRDLDDGFTLIELIIVFVIMGILAATAALKWPGKVFNIQAQADQVVQDIRYAQSLAMARAAATGQRYKVLFSGSSYTIVDDGGTTVKSVSLDSGLSFINNSFTGGYLAFDGMGRPYSGTTLMTGNVSINVSGGGLTKTITVWANTGAVQVS